MAPILSERQQGQGHGLEIDRRSDRAREGEVALLGAPMEAGSVTPGRCDLAPEAVRAGSAPVQHLRCRDRERRSTSPSPIAATCRCGASRPPTASLPIRDAVAASVAGARLTLLIGGNNAVTRPAAHGLGLPLDRVGLITLDAHFDMRDTDGGPMNGNPVRCLLEDGLPGRNLCQIGLAPFANTREMHRDARAAGAGIWTYDRLHRRAELSRCRGGARPARPCRGADGRFRHRRDRPRRNARARRARGRADCRSATSSPPPAASPPSRKLRLVDLTEFDPSLDVGDITALTAGRWVCEILAGFARAILSSARDRHWSR